MNNPPNSNAWILLENRYIQLEFTQLTLSPDEFS